MASGGARGVRRGHWAEVVAEGAAQQQILAFGAAAVGIVVAGAFNVWMMGIAAVAFMGAGPP